MIKKAQWAIVPLIGSLVTGCKTRQLSNSDIPEAFRNTNPNRRGEFRIGIVGDDLLNNKRGFSLAQAIKTYTQDIEDPTRVGAAFFKLPKGLKLQTSQEHYWIDVAKDPDYKKAIIELQNALYAISIENQVANIATANFAHLISLPTLGKRELFGIKGKPSAFVKLLFQTIKNQNDVRVNALYGYFVGAITKYQAMLPDLPKWSVVAGAHDTATAGRTRAGDLEIKFASITNNNQVLDLDEKNYDQLMKKSNLKKVLVDETIDLKSAPLDTLFISTQDGIVNNEDFYKEFVLDNNFSRTNIFLLGKNAHYESGNSKNTFANSNISTATFNQYLAAYTSGFQSAISQINYNKEEKQYEPTNVGYFIGSTTSSKDKKRAKAFKKGVIAASEHTKYAPFLNVTFVDKSSDNSEKTKKLDYSIDSWKEKDKIASFINSDNFMDADHQVMYLAGSEIRDWTGNTAGVGPDDDDAFEPNENSGLIGSIYKYNDDGSATKSYSQSRKFKLILDQDQVDNVDQIGQSWTSTNEDDKDALQRHNIKVLGFIGSEQQGIMAYTLKSLMALYVAGEDYMLKKHTLFGSALDILTLNSKSNFAYYSQARYFASILDSFDEQLFEDVITT